MNMKQSGLTLIELMMTLAVFAILIVAAGPSYVDMVERNQVSAAMQDFSASMKFSRSEAVKRGSSVTICASDDQATCTGSWTDGWIIFQDDGADGAFTAATDELIRVGQGFSDNQVLTFGSSFVTYNSRGYTTGQSGTFKICGSQGNAGHAKGLILQSTGSLRFAIDSDSDGTVEDHSGTEFSC